MTQTAPIPVAAALPENPELAPPGERYFRHPGDVVRLVLWGTATVVLVVFIDVATGTSEGLTADLGRAAAELPSTGRQLLLALAQVAAIAVPATVIAVLVASQRWRRLGIVLVAAGLGALAFEALDAAFELSASLPGAVTTGTWVASPRFPSLAYLAGASAASAAGKPWLSRAWRRAADRGLLGLGLVMAIGGTAGVPELLLAAAAGTAVGAGLLVAFGGPNRRPTPAVVRAGLLGAGIDVDGLSLVRAEGGRSQLYITNPAADPHPHLFVKVYARDSRDADLLFRGYRTLVLRDASEDWATSSLAHDVEHQALLLMLATRAGVPCPAVEGLVELPDGSMVLAVDYVAGSRLDELEPAALDDDLLEQIWSQVATLHAGRLAHRALHASNILVSDGGVTDGGTVHSVVLVDFGTARESAEPRLHALDRAELLASLAPLAGTGPTVAAAARVLPPEELATALPYLQPLGLSASTRKRIPKAQLKELRESVAATTGVEPPPLERLQRVRLKTLLTIAALTGAFYVLLPQLANVDDSFEAMGSANLWWLLAAAVLSIFTYVFSAVGLMGGTPHPIPFGPTTLAQMASSFVNRVTPANVGGMALNVRFLQKAGVESTGAVTAMGLNVVAGGIVHILLLVVFFAWAGQSSAGTFKIPVDSKMLVIIAVVLAVAGAVVATAWGRRIMRKHVIGHLKQSWTSIKELGRSPVRLVALFGGSLGVTLAYICAMAASVFAFDGGVSFAEVGAVYLGAAMIAAAAPTPGGLGALEAGLVAGLTGVGMEPGPAVAAVLSYRLVTYWLPILPGWLGLHMLERRGLI